MKIEGMGIPQQPDPKGKKIKETKQAEKSQETQKPVSDSVELNKGKKQIQNAGYSQQIAKGGASDIASKKDLSELKDRTANGYYDKREIREETSEKLIDSNELKDVVKEYHLSNLSKEILSKDSDIRHERVADAKQRIAQGYYDDPQNYGNIADKIMNHFGL